MSKRNGGGALDRERSPELPGPTDEALEHHVFEGLATDSEKLDRLGALYSGLVSNVEGLRMEIANRDLQLAQLDYVVRCQTTIMNHFKIPAPTEPPPPAQPPRRRRTDD